MVNFRASALTMVLLHWKRVHSQQFPIDLRALDATKGGDSIRNDNIFLHKFSVLHSNAKQLKSKDDKTGKSNKTGKDDKKTGKDDKKTRKDGKNTKKTKASKTSSPTTMPTVSVYPTVSAYPSSI